MNRYDKFVNSTAFWNPLDHVSLRKFGVIVFSSPRQFIVSLFLCSSIHRSATFTHSITLLPPSLFCPLAWRSIELLLFNSLSFFLSLSIFFSNLLDMTEATGLTLKLYLWTMVNVILWTYNFVYLSIYLSICLSVCLSISIYSFI